MSHNFFCLSIFKCHFTAKDCKKSMKPPGLLCCVKRLLHSNGLKWTHLSSIIGMHCNCTNQLKMIISTTDVMKNQNTCANNDLTTPFFALFENCMISISILFILKNLFKSDNEVQIMSILQMKGQFTNVLSSK